MAAGGEVTIAVRSLPAPSLRERRPEAALTPSVFAQCLPTGPGGCYNINVKWFLLLESKYKSLVSTRDMYLLLFVFFILIFMENFFFKVFT